MAQPARCPECRKWIREKRAETDSRKINSRIVPLGLISKIAMVAWAMCKGWWTEAGNADEKMGCKHEERSNAN